MIFLGNVGIFQTVQWSFFFVLIFSLTFFRTIQPVVLDTNYINLKNQIIKAERRVLKELGFCVHVKHPHKVIIDYSIINLRNELPQNFDIGILFLKDC